MTPGTRHDCLNHPLREAAMRCAACQGFFCRECAAEHEGRMICASCLKLQAKTEKLPERSRLQELVGWIPALLCLTFWWVLFYCLGRLLSSMPSSFHDNILQ